jgi:hypothetical protein
MEKELQKILRKKERIAEVLNGLDNQAKEMQAELVKSRGQGLFKSINSFANLFKRGGAVYNEFEKIRRQLVELENVDSGYLHTIGTADPYNVEGNDTNKYIISYLLSSAWRVDSSLWKVLGQVADTCDIAGNPFAKGANNG